MSHLISRKVSVVLSRPRRHASLMHCCMAKTSCLCSGGGGRDGVGGGTNPLLGTGIASKAADSNARLLLPVHSIRCNTRGALAPQATACVPLAPHRSKRVGIVCLSAFWHVGVVQGNTHHAACCSSTLGSVETHCHADGCFCCWLEH